MCWLRCWSQATCASVFCFCLFVLMKIQGVEVSGVGLVPACFWVLCVGRNCHFQDMCFLVQEFRVGGNCVAIPPSFGSSHWPAPTPFPLHLPFKHSGCSPFAVLPSACIPSAELGTEPTSQEVSIGRWAGALPLWADTLEQHWSMAGFLPPP